MWLNPGTGTDEGYLAVADVLVQFESPAAAFEKYEAPGYQNSTADPARCSMMVLGLKTGAAGMRAAVSRIRSFGCGWVLVLDRATTYTSAHVPSFWQQEAEAVGRARQASEAIVS